MPDTPSLVESPALKQSPRVSRLRLLLAAVLVLTVVGALAVRALEGRARDKVYDGFMEARSESCLRALSDFYRPISNLLHVIPEWAAREVLSFDDPARIQDHFVPILDRRQEVVALTIVGHAGRSYQLRRVQGGWVDTLTPMDELDRRESPWYLLATGEDEIGRVVTTEVPFPVDDTQPHLLAALAWRYLEDGNSRIGAAALEMTGVVTRTLSEELSVSAGSVVILLEERGMVTWLAPGSERHFESASVEDLTFSEETTPRLISGALNAWSEQGKVYAHSFLVRSGNDQYWCRFLSLEVEESAYKLGLLVPRADLNAVLSELTRPYLYALLGVVALGVLILGALYLQYRKRLRELRQRGAKLRLSEGGLRALIDQGESDRLEFKSTLRWNLKANKPGKEIEMAWLKTLVAYMNTEGGTLLVGVADDGSIVGIDPDGFKNEDKYLLHFNNCVKEHIGIAFARFLDFDLRPVEGKHILVVDVRAADDPAFLVLEDEEEFYVRVGPASRKVSPRMALDYLRKKG